MVRILQYMYYTHGSIQMYVKNTWVSGPDKTLNGWYYKCYRFLLDGKMVSVPD